MLSIIGTNFFLLQNGKIKPYQSKNTLYTLVNQNYFCLDKIFMENLIKNKSSKLALREQA
jgi:hypothetical protein